MGKRGGQGYRSDEGGRAKNKSELRIFETRWIREINRPKGVCIKGNLPFTVVKRKRRVAGDRVGRKETH